MIGSKEVSMMVKKEERNKLSWNFVLTRLTIIDRHVRGVLRLRVLLRLLLLLLPEVLLKEVLVLLDPDGVLTPVAA